MKHLVFYDGNCGLCDLAVQCLLTLDVDEDFAFASLDGKTAQVLLKGFKSELEPDSLVLIENYQNSNGVVSLYAKAVFRIYWLLGGVWAIPGLLSFFPGWWFNWAYRIVAKNRYSLFGKTLTCHLREARYQNRFLP